MIKIQIIDLQVNNNAAKNYPIKHESISVNLIYCHGFLHFQMGMLHCL